MNYSPPPPLNKGRCPADAGRRGRGRQRGTKHSPLTKGRYRGVKFQSLTKTILTSPIPSLVRRGQIKLPNILPLLVPSEPSSAREAEGPRGDTARLAVALAKPVAGRYLHRVYYLNIFDFNYPRKEIFLFFSDLPLTKF